MTRQTIEVTGVAATPSRWIAATVSLLIALPLGFPAIARPSGEIPAHEPPAAALSSASVLARYQGFVEEPVGSWVEANATVGRLGGWRFYAREASRGAPAGNGRQGADHAADPPAAQEPLAPAREQLP